MAWRGAGLIFSDGSWNSRLGFSSLMWFLDRGKKNAVLGLWFEMFEMFVHICIYVFFFWVSVSSPNSYIHGQQPVSLPYNLIKKGPSPGWRTRERPAKLPYRERK